MEPFINLVKEVASYLKETLEPVFKIVWKAAGDYVVKFFDDVSVIIDGVLGVFEGVITFLTGVFQGNWEKHGMESFRR